MNPSSCESFHDVIGIGFGPANIALAIAAEELGGQLSMRFLEKKSCAGWQDQMLLPDSDIQNHPLRDLVTPRNPRSKYTFINFLFEQGRLFEHLNLPLQHPLRVEYAQYVTWVADHFAKLVDYSSEAVAILPVTEGGTVRSFQVRCRDGRTLAARAIVLAPGRTPKIPLAFQHIHDARIVHLTQFLSAFDQVKKSIPHPRVAVIGGSQSAVELLLHLNGDPAVGELVGIHRNFGFRLKDTSPFSEEVYFPEFVDIYFHASKEVKAMLRSELVYTNYSSSDRDVIDALYAQIYRDKILSRRKLQLKPMSEVVQVSADDGGVRLHISSIANRSMEEIVVDFVVLATGFRDLGGVASDEPFPQILSQLADRLDTDGGALSVDLDYRVRFCNEDQCVNAPLFLNGLCESSHGMGDAGSFSLLSLRSAAIFSSLQSRIDSVRAGGNVGGGSLVQAI